MNTLKLCVLLTLAISSANLVQSATFSDADWVSLGTLDGAFGTVSSITANQNGSVIYVGGTFTVIGSILASNVAEWNGTGWIAFGAGLNGSGFNDQVDSLALDAQHNLYAAGSFTNSGGVYMNCLAKWNGTNWANLGSGLNYSAISIKTDSAGRLYVAGTNAVGYVVQANVVPLISGQQYNQHGGYSFNFLTTPGSTNRVFSTASVASGNWQAIGTNVAPANGFLQFTDPAAIQSSNRFYRFSSP